MPGISLWKPEGAFYLFPSVQGLIGKTTPKGLILKDDFDVTRYFLDDAGVAVIPGSPFYCPNHIRLSIATSIERIQEGIKRMQIACENLK